MSPLLREDLLQPIPGPNPAGIELRYEAVYDQIKEARREDDPTLPQGDWERPLKTADFREVLELSQEALATQSKDLQLAAWLAEALLREKGFQGLLEALFLVQGLIDTFWEGLYPELEDGDAEFRAMPLEWLGGGSLDLAVKSVPLNGRDHTYLDYLEAQAMGPEDEVDNDKDRAAREEALAAGKTSPEQFESAFEATPKAFYKELVASIDGCLETIAQLDATGDELFGRDAPSYSGLRSSIGEVRRIVAKLLDRKLEIDPDPPEPEPVETTEEVPDGAADEAPTGTVSAVPTSPGEAADRIAEAARFLRQQDPTNPSPYTLLRGFRWAEVRRGGDPPDPRLLEAPPTPVRTRLKTLLLDGNWAALLEAAEEVMATPYGRGWLDLQRYVGTALAGLGSEYGPVRELVLDSLAGLVRDLPSLPDQTLMDDSPTANRQTREWLGAEGLWGVEGEAEAGDVSPAAGPVGSLTTLVRQARQLAQSGNPSGAAELLLQAAQRSGHPRDAFLHRSEAAALMLDHGLEAVALPILDDILAEIDAHALDSWEAGPLVARPLGLMYRVRTASGDSADDLYERICRLDPVQAVRIQTAAGPDTSDHGSADEELEL